MKIIGTGSALPKKIVSNDDLAQIMDTSDEWIRTRTGIGTRHIATDETTTSLSVEAAKRAMEAARVEPEEIDLILAATVTPDHIVPTLACEVQAQLGAVNAVAFDLVAACSGFMFGLATADSYMKTGRYHKALVIGAEVLSKIMDWDDRSTCVLFGDGAGAVVVSDEVDNFLANVQGSDGTRGEVLCCPGRPVRNPFTDDARETQEDVQQSLNPGYVFMDGQAVYRFAVKTVPSALEDVIGQAGLTADDISLFILHQANMRIIESVAKRLKQPIGKFPTNLQECGNTSAASVPILLDKVYREGKIKEGDKIAMSGFGAGLTWGACVLNW